MLTSEIIKKYSNDKDHGNNVAKLSILIFQKIKPYFPFLENYDNEHDLSLLKTGAMLHDIGIDFEKIYNCPHNKAGAYFIYENKPDDIDEKDLSLLCCLIRYHRKNLPKEKHKFYKKLNDTEKRKMEAFASIIKLADSMDYLHMGLIENFVIFYNKDKLCLTFIFTDNIISNKSYINAIEKKKDFFEYVYDVEIELKGS